MLIQFMTMTPSTMVFLLAVVTSLMGLTLAKKELVNYVDLEHINVTYSNPKYYKYLNASTNRYNRKDPVHYLNVHGESLVTFGNNVTIDAFVYEFLSNEYRRSFVELHVGFCDMLFKDKFISPYLSKLYPRCPVPPGTYHLENITVPNVPLLKTFPFTKGRFFGVGTIRGTGEKLCEVYVDTAIKQRWLTT